MPAAFKVAVNVWGLLSSFNIVFPAARTPGPIGEQSTVHLARWEDFAFNRGIMNHFLGLYAKDQIGKTSVGTAVLYVTNGFE